MEEEILITNENETTTEENVVETPVEQTVPTQEQIDQMIQQSLYIDNVVATIKLLTLAFGEISKTVNKDEQQVMMTRSRTTGQYFMWISDMCFPLDEARLLLSIPEARRKLLDSVSKNLGIIEINKFALEPFTRIDGKAMPNDRVTL